MQPIKAKYRLWQVMLAVAVLAGLFAVFGVIGAILIAVLIGVILLPILLVPPGRRLVAVVGVSSLYPVLIVASLYATWITAWCLLGHRPRMYGDDPKHIGLIVDLVQVSCFMLLTFGTHFVWFVLAPIAFAVICWNVAKKKTPIWQGAFQVLIPVCAWLSVYAFLVWDPGDVVGWFFD